jgi:hypothetical protein
MSEAMLRFWKFKCYFLRFAAIADDYIHLIDLSSLFQALALFGSLLIIVHPSSKGSIIKVGFYHLYLVFNSSTVKLYECCEYSSLILCLSQESGFVDNPKLSISSAPSLSLI